MTNEKKPETPPAPEPIRVQLRGMARGRSQDGTRPTPPQENVNDG